MTYKVDFITRAPLKIQLIMEDESPDAKFVVYNSYLRDIGHVIGFGLSEHKKAVTMRDHLNSGANPESVMPAAHPQRQ